MRLGSLCTGAGMLDHAAATITGAGTAWVAELDPDASRVLAARLGAPNLGDITAVDWSAVEPVDVLVAGYPCQDLSSAGKRAGIEGARSGVWRHVADAVRHLRPRVVLLENVRGHLARGFGRVLGDLAELGYDADWTCLRASDVGAAHQRDRVFIVAAPADTDRQRVRVEPVPVGARLGTAVAGGDRESALALLPTPTSSRADRRGQPSALVAAERFAEGRRNLDDAVALLPTPTATNRHGNATNNRGDLLLPGAVASLPQWDDDFEWPAGVDVVRSVADPRWAQYGHAIRRWESILGRPAPDPTVTGTRGGRRLSARFVEWLMGWPDGWVTDLVDNTTALRLCGNGVVPQQAIAAYAALMEGTNR